jgi:hypothetical protein
MSRPWLPALLLGSALLGSGCGTDAGEDAPPIATGVIIAQAPPGAVGADVPRPSAPKMNAVEPTPLRPPPMKAPPAPIPTNGPHDPLPQTGGNAPKGTEL